MYDDVFGLDIRNSAYRHGYTDDDIVHAYRHALRIIEFDYDGEDQILLVGPARSGQIIELVLVPVDAPTRVIHANNLQPNHDDFLR